MTIQVLKANNGDSLLINFLDELNRSTNVLIDGGTQSTYQYKNLKDKITSGELKEVLDGIKRKNEKIDLLIVTHIDDDHIGGILKWIENDSDFCGTVGEIWFNGCYRNSNNSEYEIESNKIMELNISVDNNTSFKQGNTFENFIRDNKLWTKNNIVQNDTLHFRGLEFKVLSPNLDTIGKLLLKWKKKNEEQLTSKSNDYNLSIEDIITNDKFEEDDSIYNASSISFLVSYENSSILLLADAIPSDIIKGLENIGYSAKNKVKADYVKISHHGSKGNTNDKLLTYIDCDNYIISSNGKIHSLPDKVCVSRIINNNKNACIFFNYPQIVEDLFFKSELITYSTKIKKAEGKLKL